MDRNNLIFLTQPVAFLTYNMLHPNPAWGLETHVADSRDLETGIQTFDILSPDKESHGKHQLKFYDRGAQHLHSAFVDWEQGYTKSFNPSGRIDSVIDSLKGLITDRRASNEAPIRAYWLPFKMNRTYEMDLGTNADFFFTAGLSGCTVVVGGDPQAPHAAHINRMDGPELEAVFKRLAPTTFEEEMERQRARSQGESFKSRMPKATKAESTTRQILMQEIKAAASARAAGTGLRGTNFTPRTTGGVALGGPQAAGNHIFGVLDFERHYKGTSNLEATASVTGVRDRGTGNWHFVYQIFGSTGTHYYMRDRLRCLVCKREAMYCTCPP
jgi:hypothetical protein